MNMDSIDEKLAKVLEIARKEKLTAYRIAQNVSVSIPTISAILDGSNTNPRDETLNEILIYLSKRDKTPAPKSVHFEDIENLIKTDIVPKLDAIIEFINYVYPEYILANVKKEKEKLSGNKRPKEKSDK